MLSEMCFSWYRISAGVGIEAISSEAERSTLDGEMGYRKQAAEAITAARNKQMEQT